MRLLIDMNMSALWVDALNSAGIDAVHWSSIGDVATADHEIMAYALGSDWVVLTRDLDFSAILAASGDTGPSVIHLRAEDRFSAPLAARVIAVVRATSADLAAGAIVSIAGPRARVRRLPIRSTGSS
jgi:predicted nuclease of predicted toxin-antitoxin system